MAEDKTQYIRSTEQWIKIVNTLLEKCPGFLSVQDTDHENRTDTRNITSIGGKSVCLPVDSLAYNVEMDWRELKKILERFDQIQ
jgi:hypothetical protein